MRGLAISCVNLVTKFVRRVLNEPADIANAPLVADGNDRSINEEDEIFGVEEVALSAGARYDLVGLLGCAQDTLRSLAGLRKGLFQLREGDVRMGFNVSFHNRQY